MADALALDQVDALGRPRRRGRWDRRRRAGAGTVVRRRPSWRTRTRQAEVEELRLVLHVEMAAAEDPLGIAPPDALEDDGLALLVEALDGGGEGRAHDDAVLDMRPLRRCSRPRSLVRSLGSNPMCALRGAWIEVVTPPTPAHLQADGRRYHSLRTSSGVRDGPVGFARELDALDGVALLHPHAARRVVEVRPPYLVGIWDLGAVRALGPRGDLLRAADHRFASAPGGIGGEAHGIGRGAALRGRESAAVDHAALEHVGGRARLRLGLAGRRGVPRVVLPWRLLARAVAVVRARGEVDVAHHRARLASAKGCGAHCEIAGGRDRGRRCCAQLQRASSGARAAAGALEAGSWTGTSASAAPARAAAHASAAALLVRARAR